MPFAGTHEIYPAWIIAVKRIFILIQGLFLLWVCLTQTGCSIWHPGDCATGNNERPIELRNLMDDHEAQKIAEYGSYQPDNARGDAESDIRNSSIKIFFLDISEVPEPMAIDDDLGRLPAFERVSIGSGCIDPIHSHNSLDDYRTAFENAVAYGLLYNKAIAKHFSLKLTQDIDRPSNSTLTFLGPSSDWRAVHIELRDVQPIYGGRNIWIDGSGNVLIHSVRPGTQGLEQRIYPLALDEKALESLIEAFIAQDFVSLSSSDQMAPPDQGRPEIILTNSLGRRHAVSFWDPPVPGGDLVAERRLGVLYKKILGLEIKAVDSVEPIQTGPYSTNNNPFPID